MAPGAMPNIPRHTMPQKYSCCLQHSFQRSIHDIKAPFEAGLDAQSDHCLCWLVRSLRSYLPRASSLHNSAHVHSNDIRIFRYALASSASVRIVMVALTAARGAADRSSAIRVLLAAEAFISAKSEGYRVPSIPGLRDACLPDTFQRNSSAGTRCQRPRKAARHPR